MSRNKRSNGEGNTTKEGNSYRTVITQDGVRVSASAKTKIESRRLAKEKLAARLANLTPTTTFRTNTTVEEFFTSWLINQHRLKIEETTYRRYLGLLNHYIIPGLGKLQLQQISSKDIGRLFTSMEEVGQSPRSQQQVRALLSAGYRAAVEMEIVGTNPVASARRIKNVSKPITPLNIEEVKKLLEVTAGTFMHARLHIALLCGLRQGEALGLRWSDIDFDSGLIRVQVQIQKINGKRQFKDLKTDQSSRTIALPESTIEALKFHRQVVFEMREKAHAKWEEKDLVFPNRYGKPSQSKWDWQRWLNLLETHGIERRSLHSARHTAGTLMYSSGVGIETIRRVLGHSSVLLTSRTYVHTAETPLRDAATRLNLVLQ